MKTAAHLAEERERNLTEVYESGFPAVAKFISRRGGSFDEAKDIFHDALIIWYEKTRGSNNNISRSDTAYVFGIAKHLWYRRFEEESQKSHLDDKGYDFEDAPEDHYSTNKLLDLLETSGKKCLDMLKSFYYDKLSMAELAGAFGFTSVRSATVQKYKCLEKVRETVKEKSLSYENFLE